MKYQAFWSYVAGTVAGGGSAVGACLFLNVPDVESGSFAAVISGTVSAALAFAVAKRKLVHPRKLYCVAGFVTPPVLYVLWGVFKAI
jgi:hypothetical protein